jgi:hypothetical protein
LLEALCLSASVDTDQHRLQPAAQHGFQTPKKHQGSTMKLLTDLFTTDYGLMSAAGIAFMLGMAVWFRLFFKRKMDEDAKNAGV